MNLPHFVIRIFLENENSDLHTKSFVFFFLRRVSSDTGEIPLSHIDLRLLDHLLSGNATFVFLASCIYQQPGIVSCTRGSKLSPCVVFISRIFALPYITFINTLNFVKHSTELPFEI